MKDLNRVLFCVLNWGLGHASRSIPIIQLLTKHGVTVDLASDGDALLKLQQEFPYLNTFQLPPYKVKYSKSANALPIKLLCQMPSLIQTIKKEHSTIKNILKKQNDYDLVLSDNRYGCYSSSLPSVIICHQTQLKTPFGFSWINIANEKLLSKFNRLWIPDNDQNISGTLSSTPLANSKIGILSSYVKKVVQKDIDILLALSGPEPQRSILENRLLELIPKNKKVVLVRGTSLNSPSNVNIEYYNLASKSKMEDLLNRSKLVVSRSGYSSLMDYKTLGIPAILIPTPGQTEQEYLAKHLINEPQFKCVKQKEIDKNIFEWTPVSENRTQKNLEGITREVLNNALIEIGFIMPT